MTGNGKNGGKRKPQTSVQARASDGTRMERVDDNAPLRQPSRQLLGKQRTGKL